MDREWRPEADSSPWGPFVGKDFTNEAITHTDIAIICVVSTSIPQFVSIPKALRNLSDKSFSLLMWCIQVQLLLQIIINRIRLIVPDRYRSRMIMIATAGIVTAINISVFNIWVPARLQVNHTYILVNEIWDRIEKVIYLLIDAALNWYFLKVVKANLINNGLQKYNKLLRFNQKIIVVSLLMDVMIIAAMSIPNSFIYIQFHPLAYLVKLNIEMTMANLIKRIAVSTSRKNQGVRSRVAEEFDSSNLSTSGQKSSATRGTHARRSSIVELSSFGLKSASGREASGRAVSFMPTGDQIKVTKDIHIRSEPIEGGVLGPAGENVQVKGLNPGEMSVVQSKSLDDLTEGGSVKSDYMQGKGDSDDERELVSHQKKGSWHRLG
ncbi:uncharacterized protein N0V89_011528 [Didymosphaeria variabile]|uniref:Integral membrane protein n=1 Tax=Didymosphaeria variabile TaxID=1932322 RepID=A0A9W8XAQ4_9PLEO|nr:uncharacterized protein N0V89_011528 [Didymosphaeria variabile]KAJ4345398.1 hypothetical protein N0V89_011528 [Didymosphaeria variabile]